MYAYIMHIPPFFLMVRGDALLIGALVAIVSQMSDVALLVS